MHCSLQKEVSERTAQNRTGKIALFHCPPCSRFHPLSGTFISAKA